MCGGEAYCECECVRRRVRGVWGDLGEGKASVGKEGLDDKSSSGVGTHFIVC